MKHNDAIKILHDAAEELRNIYRGKHYAFWREETAPRIDNALSGIEPFKSFRDVWIHTGDASYVAATARFGGWAIDRLLAKQSPEEVLEAFSAEIAQNATRYDDASPVFGVEIDETCELENGIVIVSEPTDELVSLRLHIPFQSLRLPAGTAVLKQAFAVKPAFELRQLSDAKPNETCATHPTAETRTASRNRVRLACLLASTGPVEFPVTTLLPDERALFVAGEGNISARPFAARALVAFPVEAARIKKAFTSLATFNEIDSLARSIDRLGRSRLAASAVDRAIDLGMAAEIALMHDQSPTNTEISHKIGSRAAWLLGQHPADREIIFSEMKQLYNARSTAVHSGKLSAKSPLNLDAADRLVTRALLAILGRGGFPNWSALTLGG